MIHNSVYNFRGNTYIFLMVKLEHYMSGTLETVIWHFSCKNTLLVSIIETGMKVQDISMSVTF